MQTKTKWIAGIAVVVLVVVATLSTGTDLFTGRFGKFKPVRVPVERIERTACPTCPTCPEVEVPRYVNRAEIARIIVQGFDLSVGTGLVQHFSDVPPSHWAFEYVETAYANNIVSGMPDGLYYPGRNINRAEFATILYNVLGATSADIPAVMDGNNVPAFTDVPEDSWYSNYVRYLYSRAIFREKFKPSDLATREFVVESMANATGITVEEFLDSMGWEL